mmetsp:Transcript_71130/g.148761  ORF Transcript_71130/g.148761 Transcript_71130/m.148761 type:complete len:296 (-) Transcript_71130:1296-2183(-)
MGFSLFWNSLQGAGGCEQQIELSPARPSSCCSADRVDLAVGVVDANVAVLCGHQDLSKWVGRVDGDASNAATTHIEVTNQLRVTDIPDAHYAVVAADDDSISPRDEGDASDGSAGQLVHLEELAAGGEGPQDENAAIATRNNLLSHRRSRESVDRTTVRVHHHEQCPTVRVPIPDLSVGVGGGKSHPGWDVDDVPDVAHPVLVEEVVDVGQRLQAVLDLRVDGQDAVQEGVLAHEKLIGGQAGESVQSVVDVVESVGLDGVLDLFNGSGEVGKFEGVAIRPLPDVGVRVFASEEN